MRRFFIVAAAVSLCAATAGAQTKVTGAAQCGKPDPQHMVPVGNHSEHSVGVDQFKCTWTKPMEIGGDKSKDSVSTATSDASGNTSRGLQLSRDNDGERRQDFRVASGHRHVERRRTARSKGQLGIYQRKRQAERHHK
jgi:hypothetical protein